jgi:hypothetical protein
VLRKYLTRLISAAALLICTGIILSVFLHKHRIEPSFYYWKTSFTIDKQQDSLLRALQVHRIYTRYFDIDHPAEGSSFDILGEIIIPDGIHLQYEIVPVVFITNRALLHSNISEGDESV